MKDHLSIVQLDFERRQLSSELRFASHLMVSHLRQAYLSRIDTLYHEISAAQAKGIQDLLTKIELFVDLQGCKLNQVSYETHDEALMFSILLDAQSLTEQCLGPVPGGC